LPVYFLGELTGNVVVGLQIQHSFRGDLDTVLISPNGQAVELFAFVGGGDDDFGSSCNPFPNFVLDDSASLPVSDFSGPDPVGTFRPAQPLSTLNGLNQSGVWTLEVTDVAGADEGSLNCWCLEITTVPAISSVPALSEWGLILMAGLLGIFGFIIVKRRAAAV